MADVCKILDLSAKGVNQRLSDEVISNYPIIDSLGREQIAIFVNEDGLYDTILDSRKPEAKAFRKWAHGCTKMPLNLIDGLESCNFVYYEKS